MSYTLPCKYTRLHLGLLTTVTVSLPSRRLHSAGCSKHDYWSSVANICIPIRLACLKTKFFSQIKFWRKKKTRPLKSIIWLRSGVILLISIYGLLLQKYLHKLFLQNHVNKVISRSFCSQVNKIVANKVIVLSDLKAGWYVIYDEFANSFIQQSH